MNWKSPGPCRGFLHLDESGEGAFALGTPTQPPPDRGRGRPVGVLRWCLKLNLSLPPFQGEVRWGYSCFLKPTAIAPSVVGMGWTM